VGTWPVWIGVENFAPTKIWSPDHPASSEALYGLQYPSPPFLKKHITIILHYHWLMQKIRNLKFHLLTFGMCCKILLWKFWIFWTQWKTCLRTCHSEFRTLES
jgi:hypothetical protein